MTLRIPRSAYLKAMELLDKHGWCQLDYHRGSKSCAIGALSTACSMPTRWVEAVLDEGSLVDAEAVCTPSAWVLAFNDTASYDEVLTLLAFGAAGAFE